MTSKKETWWERAAREQKEYRARVRRMLEEHNITVLHPQDFFDFLKKGW